MTNNPAGKKKVWHHLMVLIALLVGLGFAIRLDAQVVGATLSGTITDKSGAVVPNSQVTIKNLATGIVQTVASNSDGVYSAPNLLPGNYEVTVSATGFAELTTKITLTVGAKQILNLPLNVVGVAQNVEVTVEVPTVNLEDAALGGINDETTVKELPLNGRSWSDLATLQPGVYAIHTQPAVTAPDRFNRGLGDQLSIAGARPTGNNYRLNGISINDDSNGGPGSVLGGNMGVDAISEFSVLTTNYSAEYGRASGGIINAITKSGTDAFHGDAYEFLRNSSLDARNFFDPAGGPKRLPPFKRNQFGASAGGPIRKDKTFIFADYEGLRQYLSISQVDSVPSANARAGILTNPPVNGYSNGGPPLPANFVCPAGSSVPMPGMSNTCVDDQAARYLKTFYPLPNSQVFGDTGFYALALNQPTTENYFTFRVDHKISDKDRVSVSYFRDNSNVVTDDSFKLLKTTTGDNRYYVALDETHVLSATTVNDFRVGFNRLVTGFPSAVNPINPAATDTSFGFLPGESVGRMIFASGITFFGGGISAYPLTPSAYNTPQVYDDVLVTKGVHSIKFGVAIERDQLNRVTATAAAPSYLFLTLPNFLDNMPRLVTVSPSGTSHYGRESIFGGYVQDDVRLRPNLTLNLGLRYEMNTVPVEAKGRIGNLRSLTDTAPTKGAPLYLNNTKRNFEPRVGFAWDPFRNGKTSVRGGFGIYDELVFLGAIDKVWANELPTSSSGTPPAGTFPTEAPVLITRANANSFYHIEFAPHRPYVMQWNLSVQREIVPNLTATIGYVGNHAVHLMIWHDDVNIVTPMNSPEGYLWPCEPFVPTGTPPGCQGYGSGTVTNPLLGKTPAAYFDNSALYDGLQAQLTKKMGHGFQVQGSFTWSKSIDDGSGSSVGDQFVNGISTNFDFINAKLTRGLSDFNSPRVLSINFIWDIPTPRSLHGFGEGFLGGWELGGLFSASDGQPFTALIAGDAVGENNTDPFGFPDRLTGPGCGSLINPGNVTNYIKLQCFALPAAVNVGGTNYLRLGNEGRNAIPGPGLENLDFSLIKNTRIHRISESFNVQFRAEFFNILNRANFLAPIDNEVIMDPSIPGFGITPANPATAILSGAGAIDKTTTTSRQVQFALKLIW